MDRDPQTGDEGDGSQDGSRDGRDGNGQPARKRQRVRLSCLECRRRKLSCSRELPCDRCIKSGTPERCNYETKTGSTSGSVGERTSFQAAPGLPARSSITANHPTNPRQNLEASSVLRDAAKDHDRIRRLELEVAQLRGALSKHTFSSLDGSTTLNGASPSTLNPSPTSLETQAPSSMPKGCGNGLEFKFSRGHNFKTRYFGPHNAWSSFRELTGITPFMKETAEEWLRPLNINRKDRQRRADEREKQFAAPDPELDALMPPKDETDSLVALYLDQFEQLHRILHIPTFKQEYAKFWGPVRQRSAAFTALVLTMVAVASCLDMTAVSKFVGVKSTSYNSAEKWIFACDAWLARQSQKHRRLVHYQLICMLYLAKKVNVVKKKRFWTNAGANIRDAIVVGLHQEPDQVSGGTSIYNREMRRRIWATLIEFDVQASFDQGVPTILSQIHNEAKSPRNIDDDGFNADSEELPPSKPDTEYTFSSYQYNSRRSLQLRLELNQLLTGPNPNLDWEQVTRYTEMITQELDALPTWDYDGKDDCERSHKPLLAYALLSIQLKQYLISLHQPYLRLRQYNSKYQIAEWIYYNAARDVVLMHDRLYQKGIRALYFTREDTMNATINLCNISLHQPRDSTTLIASYTSDTLKLMEKCIAMKEDRILRCGNNDPWGYSSMCAAFGLLETHLGIKPSEAAKASAAERFISLHYKLLAYQIPQFTNTQAGSTNTPQASQDPISRYRSMTPFPLDNNTAMQLGNTPFQREGLPLSMPWLSPSTDPSQATAPNPDLNLEAFGMDLNELWGGDWGGPDLN